jgi:hypothetical protein
MGGLTFRSRAEIVPLQFADVIAREAFKAVDNTVFSPQYSRRSLECISKTAKFAIEHYGRPALETVAQQMQEHGYKTLSDYLMIADAKA